MVCYWSSQFNLDCKWRFGLGGWVELSRILPKLNNTSITDPTNHHKKNKKKKQFIKLKNQMCWFSRRFRISETNIAKLNKTYFKNVDACRRCIVILDGGVARLYKKHCYIRWRDCLPCTATCLLGQSPIFIYLSPVQTLGSSIKSLTPLPLTNKSSSTNYCLWQSSSYTTSYYP